MLQYAVDVRLDEALSSLWHQVNLLCNTTTQCWWMGNVCMNIHSCAHTFESGSIIFTHTRAQMNINTGMNQTAINDVLYVDE